MNTLNSAKALLVLLCPLALAGFVERPRRYVVQIIEVTEGRDKVKLADLDTEGLPKEVSRKSLKARCYFRTTEKPRGDELGACLSDHRILVFGKYVVPAGAKDWTKEPKRYLFDESGEPKDELMKVQAGYMRSVEELLRSRGVKYVIKDLKVADFEELSGMAYR